MIQELFSRTNILVFTFICFSFLMLMFSFEKEVIQRKSAISLLNQILVIGELMDKINNSFVEYSVPIFAKISISNNVVSLSYKGFSVSRDSALFSDAEIDINGTLFFEKRSKVVLYG